MNNFIQYFMMDIITYAYWDCMLGLKLNHCSNSASLSHNVLTLYVMTSAYSRHDKDVIKTLMKIFGTYWFELFNLYFNIFIFDLGILIHILWGETECTTWKVCFAKAILIFCMYSSEWKQILTFANSLSLWTYNSASSISSFKEPFLNNESYER